MDHSPATSFLGRHEFLLRRLHSLSGLVPVGAYMVIHLLTNATVLDSARYFQRNVYVIHSLGRMLPLVEWTLIFLPIIFHAVLGVLIIRGGLPNARAYPYAGNIRYVLQRVTGIIAFVFIFWHVFQMHGWFHEEWWVQNVAAPLGGARFKAYNAASSAGAIFQGSTLVNVLYLVGILSCVFHFANGLWTMGITWGVWTSPVAQARATIGTAVIGIGLAGVGLGALWGMNQVDIDKARTIEDRMYDARLRAGDILPNEHKRAAPSDAKPIGKDNPTDAPADDDRLGNASGPTDAGPAEQAGEASHRPAPLIE